MKLLLESDPQRIRIALVEDDRLAELHVEGREISCVGDIYLGRVGRLAPAIDAAFVDIGLERNAFLHEDDFKTDNGKLAVHQPILVQVLRDAVPGKGARISCGISLPGRYLVLLAPGEGVAVSQRIEEDAERRRLTAAVEGACSADVGWIARTAARDVDSAQLQTEAEALLDLWRRIKRRAANSRPPRRLHRDLVSVERWLRDRANDSIEEIWVDSDSLADDVSASLETLAPGLKERVHRHDDESETLFTRFGVERELARLRHRAVHLPSGGSLVVESTEALVAIDVNSGRDLAAESLEETALATNCEAAVEAARQIRLRDLSGIIVIDFIDLESEESWQPVREALEGELDRDRAASQVEGPFAFGLFAITRKRARRDLMRQLFVNCPECRGSGRVLSPLEVGTAAGRDLAGRETARPGSNWSLGLHPDALRSLEEDAPWVLEQLDARFGSRLAIETRVDLERSAYAIDERAP